MNNKKCKMGKRPFFTQNLKLRDRLTDRQGKKEFTAKFKKNGIK